MNKIIMFLFLTLLLSCAEKKQTDSFINCGDISYKIDTLRFALKDTSFLAVDGSMLLFRKFQIRNNSKNDIYFATMLLKDKLLNAFVKSYHSKKHNCWSDDFKIFYEKDSIFLKLAANTTDTFVICDPFHVNSDTVLFEIGYYRQPSNANPVKALKKIFLDKQGNITSEISAK